MNAGDTGKKIMELRKKKNMTQKELAEILHVSGAAVSKWERGLNFPDLSILESLSDTLGVSAAELLCLEKESAEKAVSTMAEISREESVRREAETKRNRSVLLMTAAALFCVFVLLMLLLRDTPENNAVLKNAGFASGTVLLPFFIGIAAWGFGAAAVLSKRKYKDYSAFSLLFCAAALYLPIWMMDAERRFGSYAALDDTMAGWNMGAAVLLLGTVLFNGCAWILHGRQRKESADFIKEV